MKVYFTNEKACHLVTGGTTDMPQPPFSPSRVQSQSDVFFSAFLEAFNYSENKYPCWYVTDNVQTFQV